MKVLITGGAGFIGSNLVRFLVQQRPSWELTVLDALTYAGNLENVADLISAAKIKFVKVDITDQKTVDEVFNSRHFDYVFHLAAESHVDRSLYGAARFVETNVNGTLNLLNAALQSKVGRYLQISTDEVYGSLGPEGAFTEETPLDPTNPYAASKAAADLMVRSYYKTHNLDALITRCTNNYGPYQFPEKLIPLFITNALEDKTLPLYGDGLNVRSWIYVEDHCAALLAVAERGRAGEVYNIGCLPESEKTNRAVTEAILTMLNKPATLVKKVADRPAHDRRYAVDYRKLHQELQWDPQVTFSHGLERTVAWYQENNHWWQRIKSGDYLKFYDLHYKGR